MMFSEEKRQHERGVIEGSEAATVGVATAASCRAVVFHQAVLGAWNAECGPAMSVKGPGSRPPLARRQGRAAEAPAARPRAAESAQLEAQKTGLPTAT